MRTGSASKHNFCCLIRMSFVFRDWSIVHLMGRSLVPHLVLVPRQLQVAHIGLEGGLHEDSINKQKREKMEKMKALKPFHAKPTPGTIVQFQHPIREHEHGFGGWGHPADQHHCMELFGQTPSSTWSEVLHLQ